MKKYALWIGCFVCVIAPQWIVAWVSKPPYVWYDFAIVTTALIGFGSVAGMLAWSALREGDK